MTTPRQKDPLRPLTFEERNLLTHIAAALTPSPPPMWLAPKLCSPWPTPCELHCRGQSRWASFGRCRFSAGFAFQPRGPRRRGEPAHGGGPTPTYELEERERILAEARREPDREADGTATWSLNTLCRALRRAPDGLPKVSTHTIFKVLREAGISWQKTRGWCETGKVMRKRKSGVVEVTDPDAVPKKT